MHGLVLSPVGSCDQTRTGEPKASVLSLHFAASSAVTALRLGPQKWPGRTKKRVTR